MSANEKPVHITASTIHAMLGSPFHKPDGGPYYHACGQRTRWTQAYVVWNGPDGHPGYLGDIHFSPTFTNLVKLITCPTCRVITDMALEQDARAIEFMERQRL